MTEKSREEDRRQTFHLTPFPRFRNSSRADSGSKGWIRALNRRDNYAIGRVYYSALGKAAGSAELPIISLLPVYFNFVSRLTGYGYGQVYVAPLKAS